MPVSAAGRFGRAVNVAVRLSLVLVPLVALVDCVVESPTESSSSATGGASRTFLASEADFAGFRTWQNVPGESASPPVSVHTTGPRTVYVHPFPTHGEKSFPVGTIIVKEVETGDIPTRKVFAMVKRGGGFNASGAKDWEFIELTNVDDTHVQILWRGVSPPLGEGYLAGNGGCNGCHAASPSNDFVQTTGLQLSSL